jgi:ferredoxin/flavodoxin---NADP+ reductase
MRIAIVGAGPTGFFLAATLLKSGPEDLIIDMFEKTPFPFGLVRFGVAPDHPKIKSVTKGYQKTMAHPRFSFFGNVTLSEQSESGDITAQDLKDQYHGTVLTVGCQDDRKLGIPNEEAGNSFSATRFVGWYNGHPDDRALHPDLQVQHATIVGAGNVAIDVVRFLASTHQRMAITDASDHSLEALQESTIREIDVLVRRGAWDVAFTNPEVKELLDFEDVQFNFFPPLPPLEQEPPYADRTSIKNLTVFHELAQREVGSPRLVVNFRFQVSPTELSLNDGGRVQSVRVCHNELEFGETRSQITATDKTSVLPSELLIRSVGYRGRALADVPFHEKWGLVPSDEMGRVTDMAGNIVPGLYVSGWMRRGPSGVIGTNKKDAQEVGKTLLEDNLATTVSSQEDFENWRQGLLLNGAISKSDWSELDGWEQREGEKLGKPRRKLVTLEQVKQALSEQPIASAPAG